TVDVGDWQPSLRENALKVFDRRLLDLRHEVELPCEALEFIDEGAKRFEACLAFQHTFFDAHPVSGQHHPKTSQRARLRLFLPIEWKLDMHPIHAGGQGTTRSAAPARS